MRNVLPAEVRHIPEILRLQLQVNMVHHNGRPDLFKGPTTKYDADELAALLADPAHRIFVCEEDGAVLGYAIGELTETPDSRLLHGLTTLYIDDICVDETARGKKVGELLFGRMKQEAAACGCYNLTLNVWALNPGAYAFYEHCGLVPQKTTMEMVL